MQGRNVLLTPNKKELLKTFTIPVYTPRTGFSLIREMDEILLSDLTISFDPFTISILKKEFAKRGSEITKNEFIELVQKLIPTWQPDIAHRHKKLVRCLTLLFNDIDINGNDMLDWEEFTNFIVDKANLISTVKTKLDVSDHYDRSKLVYHRIHSIQILKAVFIEGLNTIAFCEASRNTISFLEPSSDAWKFPPLKVESGVHLAGTFKKATILDFVSVTYKGNIYLFCSCNDEYVRIYRFNKNRFEENEESRNSKFPKEIRFETAQLVIAWDPVSEVLFAGDRHGAVFVWDRKSEPSIFKMGLNSDGMDLRKAQNELLKGSVPAWPGDKGGFCQSPEGLAGLPESGSGPKASNALPVKNHLQMFSVSQKQSPQLNLGHTEAIMAILPIPKLQLLATSGMDRRIILWDTIKKTKRREYVEYHKKAVVSLRFNKSLILLFSGGLDHVIYVWNPYIDTPIHKLVGHNFPLVSLTVVESPLQLLSIDQRGHIRLWDLCRMKGYFDFFTKSIDERDEPSGMLAHPSGVKLYVYGKGFRVFDYKSQSAIANSDDNSALCCHFIHSSLFFVTPVGPKVKIWNALTGDIKRIFGSLTRHDITALAIDKFEKRIIFGDQTGYVAVFNLKNGVILKKLKGNKAEIQYLEHVATFSCIVSLDVSNILIVFDDESMTETKVLKTIDLKCAGLISLQFDLHQEAMVGITQTFQALKVDIQSGKQFLTSTEIAEDVEAFCPLLGMLAMFVLTASNQLMLVGAPPLVLKHNVLKSWRFEDLLREGQAQFRIKLPPIPDETLEAYNNAVKGLKQETSTGKTTLNQKKGVITQKATVDGFFDSIGFSDQESKTKVKPPIPEECFGSYAKANMEELDRFLEEQSISRLKLIQTYSKECSNNTAEGLETPKQQHFVVLVDDRGFIHCFEFTELAQALLSHTSHLKKKWLYDPKIPEVCLVYCWSAHPHTDQIMSVLCYAQEDFLTACCVDKSVSIVSLSDGHTIETLKQNNHTSKLRPIAYKKVCSRKIIDSASGRRIDKFYMSYQQKVARLMQEKQDGLYFGEFHVFSQKMQAIKEELKREDGIKDGNVNYDEFDPYYFLNNEFSKDQISDFRSNGWNLYVKFDKFHMDFERQVHKTLCEVKAAMGQERGLPTLQIFEKKPAGDFGGNNDFDSEDFRPLEAADQNKIENAAVKELFENNNSKNELVLPKIKAKKPGKSKVVAKKPNVSMVNPAAVKRMGKDVQNAFAHFSQALQQYDQID